MLENREAHAIPFSYSVKVNIISSSIHDSTRSYEFSLARGLGVIKRVNISEIHGPELNESLSHTSILRSIHLPETYSN